VTDAFPTPTSSKQAAALAARYGLRKMGARPPLSTYVRDLVRRRHFTWMLASSDAYGRNQGSYLGQLWGVINPLLQVGVFYLVFGIFMPAGARAGIDDFLSYLVIGTFLFNFIASGLNNGGHTITRKIALVRALEFPRAVLPISVTLTELIVMWPALIVMVGIVMIKGHMPAWSWLQLVPAIVLTYLFVLGCTFVLARVCSATPDLANLVPITTQLLRYVAGIFFSLQTLAANYGLLGKIAILEPFALYPKLARSALIGEAASAGQWALGAVYAVVALVAGFVYFWAAEARYGRD
jgi:teichoic acid transport system permease protein